MAHLWVRDSEQWLVALLDSEAFTLGANPLQPVQVRHSKNNNNGLATILRRQEANGETWALLTPRNTAVHINGMPVATGIRVLRDRDEIRMNGTDRLFFSTEGPAHIEPPRHRPGHFLPPLLCLNMHLL